MRKIIPHINDGMSLAIDYLLQPAFFLAAPAPLIVSYGIGILKSKIVAATPIAVAATNPTFLAVSNPSFDGIVDYITQVFATVIASVLWVYPTFQFIVEYKASKKISSTPESHFSWNRGYVLLSIAMCAWLLVRLPTGALANPSVLALYTTPNRLKVPFTEILIPPPGSELSWMRYSIIFLSLGLVLLQRRERKERLHIASSSHPVS